MSPPGTRVVVLMALCCAPGPVVCAQPPEETTLPAPLRTVLENTSPLPFPRGNRLPFYVLPISGSLRGLDDHDAEKVIKELDARGIAYSVDWSYGDHAGTLAEGLRIGAMQQRLGLRVNVNATACLYSFFDGEEKTLHVDDEGRTFADASFGGRRMGCPFALGHRYPVIKEQVEFFLRGYKKRGIAVDFIFADWEVDGPIEWNDAWANSKRCRRCREHVESIGDFRAFQRQLRRLRSDMQRIVFGDNVTAYFPRALVGNYGVYPHDGFRYWYDYFEKPMETLPHKADQKARYREWFPEFELTGYTFAMPVVYTWYPTFDWYDWDVLDYRWFYNMLLVASNAGKHTLHRVPIISFVHWATTAPPAKPDPAVKQFSGEKYQELLWHLLLRGHDGLFLWCVQSELAEEVRLVHEVYGEALQYREFLDRGDAISFAVPDRPGPVISGLRLGNKVLLRRTDFEETSGTVSLRIGNETVEIPRRSGPQVLRLSEAGHRDGFVRKDGEKLFPLGFYEFPKSDTELRAWSASGVNLVRCHDEKQLDRARAAGLLGWVPLGVANGPTDSLRHTVEALKDHPALGVWEGPDELVWNFTAYSGLAKTAGFTREDWKNQTPKAVAYAEREAGRIMPRLRAAIRMVREVDRGRHPFWINEAADSDVRYVRQYVESVDITGCDYYPVRSSPYDLRSIGRLTERWKRIGRGRPVWMVLQAFSWHTARKDRGRRYPSFAESRFMAYDAIAHGARGILYFGSDHIDVPAFRDSLLALTAELAALQPFLVAPEEPAVRAPVIDDLFDVPGRGVAVSARRKGDDWLVILVSEDQQRHLGVEVTGLDALDGRELLLLYGHERGTIARGELVTRLQPFETKVFASERKWEAPRRKGRDFGR